MKKRNMMLVSVAILSVLLVVGGTMAWFTATSPEVVNTFNAGTLKIQLNDKTKGLEGALVDFPVNGFVNVNPGDKYDKIVSVTNTGSKRAFIRVKLTPEFTGEFDEGFTPDLNLVTYPILNGWILHADGWYYYPQEVVANATTLNLIEEVKFAGAGMGNEYQGATFTLKVKAEAIQVTNGAALAEWGVDPLTLVLAP